MTVFQLFYEMKLKTSKFKVLTFWGQRRYNDKIQITSSSCHKNQILKSWWEWQPSFFHSCPLEQAFYFTNRPPGPNILTASVYLNSTIRSAIILGYIGSPHFVSFRTYLLSVPADKQVEYTQSTHLTLKHNEIMNWKINFSSSIIKKSATFLM